MEVTGTNLKAIRPIDTLILFVMLFGFVDTGSPEDCKNLTLICEVILFLQARVNLGSSHNYLYSQNQKAHHRKRHLWEKRTLFDLRPGQYLNLTKLFRVYLIKSYPIHIVLSEAENLLATKRVK